MNPFEICIAIGLSQENFNKAIIAFAWISWVTQLIYSISKYVFFRGLPKADYTIEDQSQDPEQVKLKNRRRFRKCFILIFLALGITKIIMSFIFFGQIDGRLIGSNPIWINLFNGVLNVGIAAYLVFRVYTTMPIGLRLRMIRNISVLSLLIIYTILAMNYTLKINKHYSRPGYAVSTVYGFIGILGPQNLGIFVIVILFLMSLYDFIKSIRS